VKVLRSDNPSPMTLDGTRTFIIGEQYPVVIDPGPADPAHLREIARVLKDSEVVAILLTHAHADHAAGAEALARVTGAPLCAAPGAHELPFPESLVGRWIEGRADFDTDAGRVRAIPTPGHSPDHLAFLWTGENAPPAGALFVGDLLLGEGDTTIIAEPEGDVDAYLRSLDRVAALAPTALYPAHGPPIEDPVPAVGRYRAHRLGRVRQVEEALRSRPGATADELVAVVYGDALPAELHGAAVGSVRAILGYLGRPAP
jgi:hydroxyacylglutathione hydrolase